MFIEFYAVLLPDRTVAVDVFGMIIPLANMDELVLRNCRCLSEQLSYSLSLQCDHDVNVKVVWFDKVTLAGLLTVEPWTVDVIRTLTSESEASVQAVSKILKYRLTEKN